VKGKVSKTLREAKTFTQEIAHSIFQVGSVEAGAEVSVEASTEASMQSEVEGAAELETNTNLEFDKALEAFSETSAGTLLSAESETEVEVKSNDLKLDLENEIESQLDLDAGIGN
jgi:hypothetical protein